MNKIQVKGDEKIQRKRRIRAVALPQLAASKLSHKKFDYSQPVFSIRPVKNAGRLSIQSAPEAPPETIA